MEALGLSTYNPLVFILAVVTAAGVSGAAYLLYVALGKETEEVRKQFGAMFFAFGLFAVAVFLQLLWTQWGGPPQYTELFGVATGLFALVSIGVGFSLYKGWDLRGLGWATAVIGLYLLQGARAVTTFQMTRNPSVTFTLWVAAGLAAIGVLPYAYAKGSARRYLAYAGAVVLAVMALAAFLTGFNAYFGHIARAVQQQ